MSNSFRPRMEILPPAQRRLWPELGSTVELGFVLYGGTAIALRLGHRASVDFDFFCEKPLNREAINAAFAFMAQSTVVQDERNALSVLVPYGDAERTHVKVSFFGAIGMGRIGEPDLTEDGVLQVASLDDLMATKVKVVLQRAEAKDYRDIVAMLGAGVSLSRGLAAAREIFGPNFQPSESLKALVYFEDGDLRTLALDDKNALVKAVSEVRELPPVAIRSTRISNHQKGFAAITAIFLVVVLAALGAYMVTFSNTQQLTSAQDLQGSRAYWAARAGLEWAIGATFAAAPVPPEVTPLPGCPSSPPASVDGFTLTISCTPPADYIEGGVTHRIYRFEATASAGGAVGSIGRVERSVSASLELPQ